jgi:hypothetical protein
MEEFMTKWIVRSSFALALSVAAVHAQAPSQAPTQSPVGSTQQQGSNPAADQARPTAAQPETITLSGCVANATEASASAAAAPTDAGASAARTDQFVLNIMPASGASSTTVAGTSGRADATMKYNLTGNATLSQYVGKRVEITGNKLEAKATAGAAAGGAPTEAHTTAPQDFRVVSVKTIEGECK